MQKMTPFKVNNPIKIRGAATRQAGFGGTQKRQLPSIDNIDPVDTQPSASMEGAGDTGISLPARRSQQGIPQVSGENMLSMEERAEIAIGLGETLGIGSGPGAPQTLSSVGATIGKNVSNAVQRRIGSMKKALDVVKPRAIEKAPTSQTPKATPPAAKQPMSLATGKNPLPQNFSLPMSSTAAKMA